MDKVLALPMLLKETTPESMASERQRREEAEELREKEASRVKVQQWMQSSPCLLSYLRAISHYKLILSSSSRMNEDEERPSR